jgi:hypothetical protein
MLMEMDRTCPTKKTQLFNNKNSTALDPRKQATRGREGDQEYINEKDG